MRSSPPSEEAEIHQDHPPTKASHVEVRLHQLASTVSFTPMWSRYLQISAVIDDTSRSKWAQLGSRSNNCLSFAENRLDQASDAARIIGIHVEGQCNRCVSAQTHAAL
jgi:hypothetical protein